MTPNRITIFVVLFQLLLIVSSQDPHGCIKNPTQDECKTFEYPEDLAEKNVDSLCKMMTSMPFCSIKTTCASLHLEKPQTYCDQVSIYKGICSPEYDSMGPMKSCGDWNTMCTENNKTVVPSCSVAVLQGVPTSKRARSLVNQICGEMYMSGCDKCKGNKPCDLLQVYSTLCLEMPDMDECKDWKHMCKFVPDWPYCPLGSNGDVVQMRMYFHTGIEDYVLIKEWVPRTWIQYFATCFAVVAFGVLYEGLKFVRHTLEKNMTGGGYQPLLEVNSNVQMVHPPFRLKQDLLRATLHFVEVMWGLLVMLIAMTYNVGLVFCVGFGAFLGSLMFGRYMKYEAKASSCH